MSNVDLDKQFAELGIVRASAATCEHRRLISGNADLDRFLDGGLVVGTISEWGIPLGLGGRRAVLLFIAEATRPSMKGATPQPVLWIYPPSDIEVYPPAWEAWGVDIGFVEFARPDEPLRQLKPALVHPLFRVFVFDSPDRLSKDDFAFLAGLARQHQKTVLVLRNQLLKPERGNVWAKLRVNAQRDGRGGPMCLALEVIRGLSPRKLSLRMTREEPEP